MSKVLKYCFLLAVAGCLLLTQPSLATKESPPIRSTVHTRGIPEDDVEIGTIVVKRSSGKMQCRIDFTQPNVYTAEVRQKAAEVYHPKLNEI